MFHSSEIIRYVFRGFFTSPNCLQANFRQLQLTGLPTWNLAASVPQTVFYKVVNPILLILTYVIQDCIYPD